MYSDSHCFIASQLLRLKLSITVLRQQPATRPRKEQGYPGSGTESRDHLREEPQSLDRLHLDEEFVVSLPAHRYSTTPPAPDLRVSEDFGGASLKFVVYVYTGFGVPNIASHIYLASISKVTFALYHCLFQHLPLSCTAKSPTPTKDSVYEDIYIYHSCKYFAHTTASRLVASRAATHDSILQPQHTSLFLFYQSINNGRSHNRMLWRPLFTFLSETQGTHQS